MATKDIERAASAVPALANTPALEISAEDVALPKLKIGQFMSDAVQEGTVPAGAFYTSLGEDDPEPNVLWEPKKTNEKDGVIVHVLSMRKGKSVSIDGELVLFAYNDPDAPPEAWVTYNYFVCLPEVDTEVPFKWLLTRTGSGTAKQMNNVLMRNTAKGPAWVNAFEAKTSPRENKKGKFFVPRVTPVEAKEENVAISEALAVMISGSASDVRATGDEPAI